MERLAGSEAGNADWQRDLSVSNNKIGDVLVSRGNLPEALKSYRAGLAIAERLAGTDTGNAERQRCLFRTRGSATSFLRKAIFLPHSNSIAPASTGWFLSETAIRQMRIYNASPP
jgi:hypothetical protein